MPTTTRIVSTLEIAQTFPGDLGTTSFPASSNYNKFWGSGTGTGQADRAWTDSGSITASGTTTLDLQGSALLGPDGVAVTFVKLKAIRLYAYATNTNNVVVTRPASNGVPLFSAAGDALPVLPDGLFEWFAPGAGVTVTAGTGDLIDLVNSAAGTSVGYDVMLIGTSA